MAHGPLHHPTHPAADGSPSPAVGDLLGPYRLDAIAGEGGMGRVFAATHTRLGKRVAVKVLRRRYARSPEAVARFFQEARAVNVARHPNIVEIFDFVESPGGGDSFYVMEWLDGLTLAQRLERDRVLSPAQALAIGRQIASAVAAVHNAGFIHRDLKPENVFLVEAPDAPVVKLLDFGVAMLATDGPSEGGVAGTPAYLSPEAAAGRPVDGRSDIYSLGVLLYELVAGAPPFAAASLSEYVLKHMTATPRPLEEVVLQPLPPSLSKTIARCLEKDPAARFQTMEEVEAQLSPEPTPEAAEARPAWTPSPRRVALGCGVMLALLVALVLGARARLAQRAAAHAKAAVIARGEDTRVAVEIASTPSGAEVYRDGVLLGVTPCRARLLRGHQQLELVRDDHVSRRDVDASEGAALSLALDPPVAGTPPAPAAPTNAPPTAPAAPTNAPPIAPSLVAPAAVKPEPPLQRAGSAPPAAGHRSRPRGAAAGTKPRTDRGTRAVTVDPFD